MLEESTLAQLKSNLESAQSVLVIVGGTPTVDDVAAALGLHLTLRNSGKDSRLLAVEMPKIQGMPLIGTDQVTTDVGNENLTISFDYSEEQVDKVSYHIGEETGKFYLTIKPKSGHQPLDTSTVEFNYTGASADMIVLVGADELESLQQLYYGYEDLFASIPIISVGKRVLPSATVVLQVPSTATVSQYSAHILQQLAFPVSIEAADNFLFGIEHTTQGFSAAHATSPETFEVVGALLRMGAHRLYQKEKPVGNGISTKHHPQSTSVLEMPPNKANRKKKPASGQAAPDQKTSSEVR